MPTWSRANALMYLTSPLGTDALIPIHFSGHEGISETFSYDIQVVSQNGIIQQTDLLYQPVCLALQGNTGSPVRYFHGIVQELSADGVIRSASSVDGYQTYRLHVVPKLWFLGQTTDCRVFQNMSVPDILQQMFNDAGLSGVNISATGAATREYTVQFNESDLHFATRLMEEEGFYYFFRHSDSAHTLVIANVNTAFTDIPDATLNLTGDSTADTWIGDWSAPTGTTRGKMTFKDYDPTRPDTVLKQDQPTTLTTGGVAARDDFRWPALSYDTDMITNRATWNMEAAEVSVSTFEGGSRFLGMVAGGTFKMANRPASPYDGTYAVRSVSFQASDETWLNGGPSNFANRFTAFLSSMNWRQPLMTPRPRMDGIHTALVLGPQHTSAGGDVTVQGGEEIYTDDLARVKVRFHWDHRGEATGSASCWARVVQPWAGNGWGAQFIPRIGTEVAVAFVDGDPDRPIVIGGLYNGRDAPIYSKDDKTKSGFRSKTSLQGGAADFSEFTFDDKKDSELIYMHAQKDLTTEVENDQTLKVDNCRIVTVKKDETVDIQGKQTITVKGDRSLTVSEGNDTFTVSKGNRSVTVSEGNDTFTVSKGNHTLDVAKGKISITADQGSITLEAMQKITLKVGSNTVTIDQKGFSVDGLMLDLKGSTKAQFASPLTTIKGDGMLTLKGGMVNVN